MKISTRIKSSAFIVIVLFTSLASSAQKRVFIGIQPAVTKETFYVENEFDINIIPIVAQTSLSKRVDLRIVTLANYHFGSTGTFSDVGVNLIAPVYLKKKEKTNELSSGFYIGPLLGLSKNLINEHNTINTAAEVGYLFPTEKRFTLMMGFQLGGTYFAYENKQNIWRNHMGFKINLGFWL